MARRKKPDPLAALRIDPTPENLATFTREREFHRKTFQLMQVFMIMAMRAGKQEIVGEMQEIVVADQKLFDARDKLRRHLGMINHSDEMEDKRATPSPGGRRRAMARRTLFTSGVPPE